MTREPKKIPGVENRPRRHRDGTVYWRFRVRWVDPVTGSRLAEEFDRQQDAVDFRAALRLARRGGQLAEFDRGRITLADFVAGEWWPKYAAVNLARNTLPSYRDVYNRHLLPRLGGVELRHLKEPVVQQLREDLESAPCGSCAGTGRADGRPRITGDLRRRAVAHLAKHGPASTATIADALGVDIGDRDKLRRALADAARVGQAHRVPVRAGQPARPVMWAAGRAKGAPATAARPCPDCKGRGTLGPATVRRAMAILQAICRYAVTRGEMSHNPVKEVEKPVVTRQLTIVAISPEQVEALLDELDPASRTLAALMAYEGLRPEEALALEDRHLGQRSLLVEQRNVKGTIVPGLKRRRRGRSRDNRSPDLFAPVRQDLAGYRLATSREQAADGRQLLIPRPDGEPWTDSSYRNWRRRVFKPAVERAGLPITRPYDLRHACASLLIHAGWPLTEVAEHLGHTVATLSQDYAHVIADMRGRTPVPPADAIAAARAKRRHQDTG